jgi:hypothetical protein
VTLLIIYTKSCHHNLDGSSIDTDAMRINSGHAIEVSLAEVAKTAESLELTTNHRPLALPSSAFCCNQKTNSASAKILMNLRLQIFQIIVFLSPLINRIGNL